MDVSPDESADELKRIFPDGGECFRCFSELGLIGMALTSPTKGIIEVNAQLCKILGYERGELLQKTWSELTHPDDLAADIAQFNRVMAGEIDSYSIDKRWIRKDDQIIDATISVRASRRADGSVDYFVALLQDVTERKLAEAALRRARDELEQRVIERTEQFSAVNAELVKEVGERRHAQELLREAHQSVRIILNSITDSFFGIDKEWRYTHFNKHAEEQLKALGKNPASLIGRLLWDEFPNPTSGEQLRRAMTERAVVIHEHYYPPLGEWVENRIYPSLDGGLAVFQRYVTERRQAQEELRRSEAYLAEGQRLSHTGSWAWNASDGDLFWSEEHYRICGLDPEKERPVYPAMQWIHPEDRAFAQDSFEQAIREKSDFELDCRVVWTDGTIRYVHSLAHPVFDEANELTEYVGTIIDNTERKRAEEERTHLLQRLITAQEEERSRLAREMHDQFGQQLSALSLKIAALRRGYGGQAELGEQLDDLDTIARELDRNVDFLVWELRPTALDDLGLVVALSNYVQTWAKHFGVEAELHTNGMEKDRLTNEVETVLYRVTQEALTNAAKHAGAEDVSILLERHPDYVSLIVEDDGVGFEVEQTLSTLQKGFGLAGMRERAALVGGTLEIESSPGQGVTIRVSIPVPHVPAGGEEQNE